MATPNIQRTIPQPLYCNHDHFWMALNTYYQHTGHQEILAKWTEEEFDSNVVKVLSEQFGDKLTDQPLRVLGVGSSEGNLETLQLQKLKTKFSRISATVIEPSTEQISKYQEMVHQKSSNITGIEYSWYNQTFQEFVTSMEAGQKYHFITIVHAIYYTGKVEETVQTFYELLEPGGMILMIITAGRHRYAIAVEDIPSASGGRAEGIPQFYHIHRCEICSQQVPDGLYSIFLYSISRCNHLFHTR
ncbi:histamine N-methyltransferase-like [Amphiura filiformis]|uniref:histamine N-methyltransferase-like n=1 Tax=Amphiura filiformis TaxID=82378 RepID=UPI003B21F42D